MREENKYFSGRGFPPPSLVCLLSCGYLQLPKSLNFSWKKDKSAAGAGGYHRRSFTSLQHQPPWTLPVPFRLRKPLTSGIAMSSFHSLESQAGVKALNSHTALWVGWLRNTEDCIPLCIFLVVGWAGPPQVRFHIPSHNLQMGTYSSAFQACQKAAREAVPLLSHDSLMMTEITQHGLLGLIFFCYWAENNVPLIGVEFDLKWEGFRIHIVIGPTSPLPNAPDTGISFILLTFYYLVNLSCYVDSAKSH